MWRFLASYAVFEVAVIVIAVGCTFVYSYKRRHPEPWVPPEGFQRTNEIFIDPTTGLRKQVWYNPETGERQYETRRP